MAAVKFSFRGRPHPISVEAYRRSARRRLPSMAWAYVDGGADSLVTLTGNVSAFAKWRLRQRCLTGVTKPKLSTRMLGTGVALPIGLAPIGLSGLARWDADLCAVRAAEAAGTRLVLSTGSSWSLEEVAGAVTSPHWFQLYPFGDHRKVGDLLKRAEAAGYASLLVTVDTPVRGNRERERETGMGIPLTLSPGSVFDAAIRPRWWWNLLRHNRIVAIHYAQSGAKSVSAAVASAQAQDRHMQGDLNWTDLAWLREQWRGPLYVKGVLDPEDAAKAVDEIGAQGVVVSNHGGRQLDRTLSTLDALPRIVDRLGGRGEVYLDGGIRRGGDVIIALALGAKGVFIGRPYIYGAAVDGERGVADVLDILRGDMARDLTLMGCRDIADLDRSWIIPADRPTIAPPPSEEP